MRTLTTQESHGFSRVECQDVYFANFESMKKVVEYYIHKFNSNATIGFDMPRFQEFDNGWKIYIPRKGIAKADREVGDYEPIFLSSSAITLSKGIQIITKIYGEPEETTKKFDFAHCQCYYRPLNHNLPVLPAEALESIITRELTYTGSDYPLAAMIRTRKFIQRGWKINAGQYVKMAFDLSKVDLYDPTELESQLVGVDLVLFADLIGQLRKWVEDGNKITSEYVFEVINKVFDEELHE